MANAVRKIEVVESGIGVTPTATSLSLVGTPVHQAYRVLQFGFIAAPIIAGADKFFHVLVNWDQYLAPVIPRITGIDAHSFMLGVGVVEIIAGIGVALKPKFFGYVVSAWLMGIVGNLLIQGAYYDIALRDFGLALGAFALGLLGRWFDRRKVSSLPT